MKARRKAALVSPHTTRVLRHRFGWLVGGTVVLAVCLLVRHRWTPEMATAKAVRAGPSEGVPEVTARRDGAAARRADGVVAVVNGESIHRDELGRACLVRFGSDVLESLVNTRLIAHACQCRNVVIANQDVEAEIERMANRFRLGKEQWLAMLEKERGITAEQYARDIVWPTLALRQLASQRLQVSAKELEDAYESQFGPAVRARLITVDSMQLAQQIHAQLLAHPDDFVKLAREQSQDISSASMGGLIPPIRRNAGDQQIEQVAFALREGEISPIIRLGEQYAVFKCEGHLPARNVPMEQVAEALTEKILDGKLRAAADDIFKQLQAEATVKNVLNDAEASRRLPGVAATINGQPIGMETLIEECVNRHGRKVLEAEINRRLVEQALRKSKLDVTQSDLDAQIAHTAALAGVMDSTGKPDVAKWIEMATEHQGITRETYFRDAVWPSAALKKLVQDTVEVQDEDLRKGYEANYGPRVRCRAIVMSNLRRAQEVWDKARKNPTVDFFGDLAEQYSIEPTSRALRGEVPPVKRHGGQPIMEREAFALQPNELSGIVQIADTYVILFCEGHTKPIQVDMAEVRDLLYEDLHEKKLRIAMDEAFERLHESAQVDNYLTGTSQAPKRPTAADSTAGRASRRPALDGAALRPGAPTRR